MFGFGRRAAISRRAVDLGRTVHHLVSCIQTQNFDEFVESMGRKDFKESYVDRGDGLSLGDKAYGFFEIGAHAGEFSFHAQYPKVGKPVLIIEGHEQYFGLVISGCRLEDGIFVDLKDGVVATGRVGRDATTLQAELVKLPGFESMKALMAFLGRR